MIPLLTLSFILNVAEAGLMEWIPCEKECKTASLEVADFDAPARVTGNWVSPGVARIEWEKLTQVTSKDRVRIETRTFGGEWIDVKQVPGETVQVEIPGFVGKASRVEFRVSRFREVAENRAVFRSTEFALVLPGDAVKLDVFFGSGQAIFTFKDDQDNAVVHFERKIFIQFPGQKKKSIVVSTGDIGVHSLSLPLGVAPGRFKVWWKPKQSRPDEFELGPQS